MNFFLKYIILYLWNLNKNRNLFNFFWDSASLLLAIFTVKKYSLERRKKISVGKRNIRYISVKKYFFKVNTWEGLRIRVSFFSMLIRIQNLIFTKFALKIPVFPERPLIGMIFIQDTFRAFFSTTLSIFRSLNLCELQLTLLQNLKISFTII